MRRLALFLALAFIAAPVFAQRSDTCRVYMQMYDYTGAPARYVPLQIKRMVLNGVNIVIPPRDAGPSSDGAGVVQFRAIKNATVWLYAQTAGLDSANVTGKPVALSGDAVQWIVPTTAASVPPRYVVSIADLWAGKGATAGLVDSILFTGAGVTVTKSFGALTVDIPGGGGTSAYGDSIHVADSVARAAVTTTRLRDSLARHFLTMGDSLSARMAQTQAWVIARGYMLASDSTIIHQRAHTWTAQQRYIASLADGASFVPILLQGWTNPDAGYGVGIQRNDFGANRDYTFRIGYNPYRRNTSEPELVWQFESNYFNSDSLLEAHLAAVGQNGSASRGMTGIARRSTGRWIDIGYNVGKLYVGDTLGIHPAWLRFDSPSRTIDLDTSAAMRILQANQTFITAFNGTSYVSVLGTAGNTILDYGGSGWTQNRFTAGSYQYAMTTYGKFYLPLGSWSGTGSDSLISASKGYVDTRIAGLSFLTPAQLSDSLNAGTIRPGVLAAYATLAAMRLEMRDSVSAALLDTAGRNLRTEVIDASTGTAGQVLTNVGGSTAKWATPAAGGAFPSDSLNNALTLNTGRAIGAEIDVRRGTGARIDSFLVSITVQDSAMVKVDTGYAQCIKWTKASGYNFAGRKYGSVTFRMHAPINYQVPFGFVFVADSSNSVRIRGVRSHGEYLRDVSGYVQGVMFMDNSINAWTTPTGVVYTSAQYGISASQSHAFLPRPTGSAAWLPVDIYSSSNAAFYEYEMKVTYDIPVGNNSESPIKLIGW